MRLLSPTPGSTVHQGQATVRTMAACAAIRAWVAGVMPVSSAGGAARCWSPRAAWDTCGGGSVGPAAESCLAPDL